MTHKPKKAKRRDRASKSVAGKVTPDIIVHGAATPYGEEPVSPGSDGSDKGLSEPVPMRQMVLAALVVGLLVIAGMTYFYLRSR